MTPSRPRPTATRRYLPESVNPPPIAATANVVVPQGGRQTPGLPGQQPKPSARHAYPGPNCSSHSAVDEHAAVVPHVKLFPQRSNPSTVGPQRQSLPGGPQVIGSSPHWKTSAQKKASGMHSHASGSRISPSGQVMRQTHAQVTGSRVNGGEQPGRSGEHSQSPPTQT